MLARNLLVALLIAIPSSTAADLLVQNRLRSGSASTQTRANKTNSTFVPIWAIVAPWLAEDSSSNSNAARLTTRRRRARDQERESDGYVSDDDRYDALRGSRPEPQRVDPPPRTTATTVAPMPRSRRVKEQRDVAVEQDEGSDDRNGREPEVRDMRNDRYFRRTREPVHKLGLAVVNSVGLGAFGFDRCLMDQVTVGIVKGVTLGGCGIWALIDFVVITVNCLMFWHSIQAVGFDARFETGTVTWAFWATLVMIAFKMCLSAYYANQRKDTAHMFY